VTAPKDAVASGRLQAAQRASLDAALAGLVPAFAARGVEALLIKGPAFARWLYDDPADRHHRDIDLLVSPDQLDGARLALAALGFVERRTGVHAHERAEHHELWVRDGAFENLVELHHTLALVSAEASLVWSKLSAGSETIGVGGATVRAPGVAASALIAGVHAAQHGSAAPRALEDLRRAIERAGGDAWNDAADIARTLRCDEALATGLRLIPTGAELAERLGLPAGSSRALRLGAATPPRTAVGIEQIAAARGLDRIVLILRKVAPSPESMRYHYPAARRGRGGLAVAYAARSLTLLAGLPRGLRAWRAAGRAPRP
jgi:hypothetical protein